MENMNFRLRRYTLFILLTLTLVLVSCSSRKEQPKQTAAPQQPKVVMDVSSGTRAPKTEPVDTIPGQTHIKITCRCLATTDPALLDIMPRDLNEVRRDSSILSRINRGEVYVVNPGETGYILAKDGNKLQLRFPDKIAWVMVSNTK